MIRIPVLHKEHIVDYAIVDDDQSVYVQRRLLLRMTPAGLRYAAWYDNSSGKCVTHFLHREIMNPLQGMDVAHLDDNGLNCQIDNMRVCTRSQNLMNTRKIRGQTSKYKGVSWYDRYQKWLVQIKFNGTKFNLGYFLREFDAAMVYDEAARRMFSEFAKVNFMPTEV